MANGILRNATSRNATQRNATQRNESFRGGTIPLFLFSNVAMLTSLACTDTSYLASHPRTGVSAIYLRTRGVEGERVGFERGDCPLLKLTNLSKVCCLIQQVQLHFSKWGFPEGLGGFEQKYTFLMIGKYVYVYGAIQCLDFSEKWKMAVTVNSMAANALLHWFTCSSVCWPIPGALIDLNLLDSCETLVLGVACCEKNPVIRCVSQLSRAGGTWGLLTLVKKKNIYIYTCIYH